MTRWVGQLRTSNDPGHGVGPSGGIVGVGVEVGRGVVVGIGVGVGVAVGLGIGRRVEIGTGVGVAVTAGGAGVNVDLGNGAGVAKGVILVELDDFVGSGFGGSFVGEGSTSTLATTSASVVETSVI
jgi:hypothetical protein